MNKPLHQRRPDHGFDVRRAARAKLPPPRVGIHVIERLLLRHVNAPLGGPVSEQRLVVAVICQALVDACCGTRGERRDAKRFLRGPDLVVWAARVDLHHEFIREVAIKTNYLLDEPDDDGNASNAVPGACSERRDDAGLQSHHTPA